MGNDWDLCIFVLYLSCQVNRWFIYIFFKTKKNSLGDLWLRILGCVIKVFCTNFDFESLVTSSKYCRVVCLELKDCIGNGWCERYRETISLKFNKELFLRTCPSKIKIGSCQKVTGLKRWIVKMFPASIESGNR